MFGKFDALGWLDRKVRELDPDEIVTKFGEGMATPSANEQMYRWASTAVNKCLSDDILGAKVKGQQVPEGANPFEVLTRRQLFRSPATLTRERQANGARTPLGPSTTLGTFLEAAWSKKDINDGATGVHYLILMLLWGCRASEHAACRWGELLSAHGEPGTALANTSHVWLRDGGEYGPYVLFHDTKNHCDHRLPIAPMALNLLRQRQKLAAEEVARRGFTAKSRPFVFPARSRFSSTGHYMDATDLLDRIRDEAGIARLTRHDLRRSFGSVMRSLGVDEGIKSRFFNHGSTNVTAIYTAAEWALLRHEMERIEQAILVTAPNVFNALKPTEWPPLAAPDPHECKPAKPRSGRPRKEVLADADPAYCRATARTIAVHSRHAHELVLSVSSSNVRLADLEVLECLGRLPDGVALTTDEAAVFLRLSRTSMERMRRLGTGPDCIQGGGAAAKGTNQKCSDLKRDLIDWQQSNRVSNSTAAAVRRGQAYMPFVDPTPKRSYFDFVTHRAFHVDKNDLVAGSMDDTMIETVIARLGRWRIVWLNPVAAVDMNWSDAAAFNEYGSSIQFSLSRALEIVTKALKA